MNLVETIRSYDPVLYWRGRPGTTGILKDLSGRGNHSTASAGTIGRTTLALPGDPITGWSADSGDAAFILGGAITGFNAAEGTILTIVQIKNFATGSALRGLFDTAPGAAGAVRLYSVDDFATMNREIGGDAGASFTAAGWARHPFAGNRYRVIALRWTNSGDNYVIIDGTTVSAEATHTNVATSANLQWGRVNTNSIQGGTVFHTIAVFAKAMDPTDIAIIQRAAYTTPSRNKLTVLSGGGAPAVPAGGGSSLIQVGTGRFHTSTGWAKRGVLG